MALQYLGLTNNAYGMMESEDNCNKCRDDTS